MDGTNFLISRLTLPEAAAERLRTLIIEGELEAGARLNERELCQRLGLSRTPLREAFRILATEGLIAQLPNRGAQVIALGPEDVRQAFDVMSALEGLAGELAAQRVTDGDIVILRALQSDMETAHGDHDLPGYYRVNRAIHEKITGIAGNAILAQSIGALNTRLHALRFRSNVNRAKWDRAVVEHRHMLDALTTRDGDALRRILAEHLRAKRDAVLETMGFPGGAWGFRGGVSTHG